MKTILFISLFSISLLAQDRFLLRIGEDGRQEAIPLGKGEQTKDAIERLEDRRNGATQSAGLIDTLKHYPAEQNLNTNFGFTHQDVALQWYLPDADGIVKEFWWRNYEKGGNIRKATIRAWYVDERVSKFPSIRTVAFLGFYLDPNDNDGRVTPYKPMSGDQWFYKRGLNSYTDSLIYGFDPFGEEAKWLAGGLQVSLDSIKWQHIKLNETGDTLKVIASKPFGFSLQNDTKISDINFPNIDERMEILSFPNSNNQFHSLKFYETSRDGSGSWWLRGDYEWGMYAVIEYTGDRPPKIIFPDYNTTVRTSPRPITVTVTDDNPGGGAAGVASVRLFTKKGKNSLYDSAAMTGTGSSYIANAPARSPHDTLYWYVAATDVNGNRTLTPIKSFRVFFKQKSRLMVVNFQPVLTGILPLPPSLYDRWSTVHDGTAELSDLFALYDNVLIVDADFPARNVYPALAQWLKTGTAGIKKNLFLTSQDYGCFIQANCADTTFSPGSWEYDFLGIEKLGPQDLPPANREMRTVPQPDSITNYLIQFEKDSGSTLWYYPTFELGFNGTPDAMTARSSAKPLFTTGPDAKTIGVVHRGSTFNAVFLGLDESALQFRSDTSLSPASDPKYAWILDVKSISNSFFESVITSVKNENEKLPLQFSLSQNFPNPFNPTTTIEYSVAARSEVKISIFNTLGQKVATIVNETKDEGTHKATFNAQSLASGIYFYEMRAGGFVYVKKMVMMK